MPNLDSPDFWRTIASTNKTYVLVRKNVYDRIKGLLPDSGGSTDDELRLLLARSAEANGWNEPAMDDYDESDALLLKVNDCLKAALDLS